MAVTKTHPIKSTLKAAIDYICNPDKTDGKLLVSSFGCTAETADIEFEWTRRHAIDKGTHLGRHLIQAFEPGEVSAEEKELLEQKMAQLQTKRIGAYLRKMAIDGYIIYVDTRDIKEMNKLLSAIGRNINQIAKRVNAGGPTYQADMEEIRERLDQIWQLQRRILLSQR